VAYYTGFRYIINVIRRGKLNRQILIFLVFCIPVSAIVLTPCNAKAQVFWDVTVVESIGDTLIIHVIPSNLITCGDLTCPCWAYYWLRITPCPLFVDCNENQYSLNRPHYRVSEFKILSSETYVFSGEYNFFGSYSVSGREYEHDCSKECEIHLTLNVKVFPDDYVSTSETTWGNIKALYIK